MKRTDIAKNLGIKIEGRMKQTGTPGRFAGSAVLDRKEQRKLDQARGLIPFAIKLDAQLADPHSERKPDDQAPAYARNATRSIKPEYLVVVGICTHLGCSPSEKFQPGPQPSLPDDWQGGFFCPCHGSTFDLAGRVFKNKPAPDNLQIPAHVYLSETKLLIGDDKKA